MVFTPDMRLADRYRLIGRIGLGGMSEVWRASDELLGRPVAIKVLASPLAADPAMRAGTRREAMAAARLTHPHVTQVYDYGEARVGGGAPVPYLVMELVDGQNLADRIGQGPLPWPAAVRVAAQVAAGLAAAHQLGVVHRDVKPGNVMLTTTGAKILDFGIAALAGAHPDADAGLLFGTPAYIAPERLHTSHADPAGDVYSLGALLYESLTGHTPIAITSWAEAAAAHQRAAGPPAPRVPGLPVELVALCLACLSHDPAHRPRADEVAARLAAALGGLDAVLGTPGGNSSGAPGGNSPGPTGPVAAAARAAHPPTLIDRSLIGPGPRQPPASVPAPSAAPAGGPSTATRITGSAAVHRAPAPAPEPAADEFEPDGTVGRPPRSRLAIVAVVGSVIAAGLTIILIASALGTEPTSTGAAPAGPTTASGPAPSAETEPPVRKSPTSAEGIVEELDLLITEAYRSHQISEDVAKDLRDKLDDVREKLNSDKPKDLRKKADDFRKEIRDHEKDREIPTETADLLRSTLQPLLGDEGDDRRDDE